MKIVVNPELFKTPPFKHQIEGITKLVNNDAFALLDEMGVGKSYQVVNAACVLAEHGKIDTVIVVVPASCRCVWVDSTIGEIRKHSWLRNEVLEFHAKSKLIWENHPVGEVKTIRWIVTNYEFLRNQENLDKLISMKASKKTMLVLDESSYIKNRTAKQTKAILALREHCQRCVILNGTPITNSPLDLWSQMNVLSPKILQRDYKNFFSFRYEYCEMRSQRFGGRVFQQVASYRRLDQLAKKIAPYVLRRLKKDCLDLPEKLYTTREVALTPESWKRYKELKQDLLITLDSGDKQLEPNAAVRLMRLVQLTSGILGGYIAGHAPGGGSEILDDPIGETQDLSDEKLKWLVEHLIENCQGKAVIVWTRWRRERERIWDWCCQNALNKMEIYQLYGGQDKKAREEAVTRFSSPIDKPWAAVLLAQPHAGGHGLNLIAASEAIYLSNDFALGVRLQSEDRCHRPGQVNPVTYVDVLATGPQGQRTIDHIIFEALRDKQNIATMTCENWRRKLES